MYENYIKKPQFAIVMLYDCLSSDNEITSNTNEGLKLREKWVLLGHAQFTVG